MGNKFKVVITDFISDALSTERKLFGDLAEVTALDARRDADLVGRIEDADALIVYHCISLRPDIIQNLKNCKLIVRAGVGIDNVDHGFARKRGIPVANIPDYGSEEVADSAIGMMLSLMRGVNYLNSRLRDVPASAEVEWTYLHVKPIKRLRGLSLGVVGLGRIGTAVAVRAKALGMNVKFYDPFKPDGYDKALGIRRVEDLKVLFQQSDALTLHCPLTPETVHIVNGKSVNDLPKGAFIINTARGGIVDTRVIPKAIENGQLAGAAFDVLEKEPPTNDPLVNAWRNPDHPAHHRVIINPHAAFYSEAGLEEIRVKAAEACIRALTGGEVRNVVN